MFWGVRTGALLTAKGRWQRELNPTVTLPPRAAMGMTSLPNPSARRPVPTGPVARDATPAASTTSLPLLVLTTCRASRRY